MPNPNQLAKAIQQKKNKQQRVFKTSSGLAKLEQQTQTLNQFNLKAQEMDQAQVFIGDKCVQFDKPIVQSNHENVMWTIRGDAKEVPAESTKYMKQQKQSMEQLIELLKKNSPAPQQAEEEKVEENAQQ